MRSTLVALMLVSLFALSCGKKPTNLSAKTEFGNWKLVATTFNLASSEMSVSEASSHIFQIDGDGNVVYLDLPGKRREAGTYTFDGTSLVVNIPSINQTYPAQFEGDSVVLTDPNPAISSVKSRRYSRISDTDRDALIAKYNVK